MTERALCFIPEHEEDALTLSRLVAETEQTVAMTSDAPEGLGAGCPLPASSSRGVCFQLRGLRERGGCQLSGSFVAWGFPEQQDVRSGRARGPPLGWSPRMACGAP